MKPIITILTIIIFCSNSYAQSIKVYDKGTSKRSKNFSAYLETNDTLLEKGKSYFISLIVTNTSKNTSTLNYVTISLSEGIICESNNSETIFKNFPPSADYKVDYIIKVKEDCPFSSSILSYKIRNPRTNLSYSPVFRLPINYKMIEKEIPKDNPDNSHKISDIDLGIPNVPQKFENRFALIIGNEDYSSFQNELNTEVNVLFAKNDAKIFKEYCNRVIGVPESNIILIEDGTTGKINSALDKINKLIKITEGEAEVIFYYAGHGLPDENTKESYLIPVDVSGSNVTQGIKISDVYKKLTEHPSKRITVFLDACFSGGARNQGLIASRGVKIKTKEDNITGNIVVFSAVNGEQTALPYKEQGHGLFTYFLLKKLQETNGNLTYEDLARYLEKSVGIKSMLINDKEQTPQVVLSPSSADVWKKWKIR